MKIFTSIFLFFTLISSSFAWSAWDFPDEQGIFAERFDEPLYFNLKYGKTCKKPGTGHGYYQSLAYEKCEEQLNFLLDELEWYEDEFKKCDRDFIDRYEPWCKDYEEMRDHYKDLLGWN